MAKYSEIIDINKILNEYSNEIQEGTTNAAIEIAEKGKSKLRQNSPKNTGKYRKGWRVDKRSGKGYVHTTIYNATDWQLTHLLEKPHAIKNQYGEWGTYSPEKSGTVHIAPVEEECVTAFQKDVEQIIKEA